MPEPSPNRIGWERVIAAVEKVHERLNRSTSALESAGVPYAVTGGNAVAAWVRRAELGGERNTPDVDILIRRDDFGGGKSALESVGFVHCRVAADDVFLDGPLGKVRQGIDILYAGEWFRPHDLQPNPDVTEAEPGPPFRFVGLEPLVRMKLVAHRRIDRVHLRDMIDVGLIDATWPARFPPELAARLQAVLDDPDG